jgi:hypothetical protein
MNLPQKKAPEAWMTGNLFAIGIGHVIIARYKGSGDVEVGVFLVDTFCLGVKDSLFRKFDGSEFEPALEDMLRGEQKKHHSCVCPQAHRGLGGLCGETGAGSARGLQKSL